MREAVFEKGENGFQIGPRGKGWERRRQKCIQNVDGRLKMWGSRAGIFPSDGARTRFFDSSTFEGKKGEGGFFCAYILSTKEERLFEGKTHECISHTSPGLHFQNATENAHSGKGKCNLRTLCPSSSSSFIRERVIPNFSLFPFAQSRKLCKLAKREEKGSFPGAIFRGKGRVGGDAKLGTFFPQEIRANDNPPSS